MTTLSDRPDTDQPLNLAEDPQRMPRLRDYLATDRGTPPPFFFEETPESQDAPHEPVPVSRFTSKEWHAREVEKMWRRTWQMACRENDIPLVGDQLVYDIAGISVVVVRGEERIRAFRNFCRHRGNMLVTDRAHAPDLTCSFHGWSWKLDGSLRKLPCRWDMPGTEDSELGLNEVRTEIWQGLVFINLDSSAGPLTDFLGPELKTQLERWPHEHYWKAGHVAKVMPCNWKVALEAFMEGYHLLKVHPQLAEHAGDCNAQYDHYGPHARFLTAVGVPSPHLGGGIPDADVVHAMLSDAFAMLRDQMPEGAAMPEMPTLPEGMSARDFLSDFLRSMYKDRSGIDLAGVSDTEVLDAIDYFIFPNFIFWGGFSIPLYYRFRPNGNDPDSCIFEMFIVAQMPAELPLPPDAPMRTMGVDEAFSDAAELAAIGPLIDQDAVNLVKIQRGLHSSESGEIHYLRYQERTLQNFHAHLGAIVDGA